MPCTFTDKQQVINPITRCQYQQSTGSQVSRDILYKVGDVEVKNNIVNVLEGNVEQYGDTCYISLIQPKFDLEDIVFNFDILINTSYYGCTKYIVAPIENVKYNMKDVTFTGIVKISDADDKEITINHLSFNGKLNGKEVSGIANDVKVNGAIAAFPASVEGQIDYAVLQNKTFLTFTQDMIQKVSGSEETPSRTVYLAYCENVSTEVDEDIIQTAQNVLHQQIKQEAINLNEFKYLFYGASVYGLDSNNLLIPIELASDNTKYVIRLGEQLIAFNGQQMINCSGQLLNVETYGCVSSCSEPQIKVDDFYCTANNTEVTQQLFELDDSGVKSYYTSYQVATTPETEGECANNQFVFGSVCVDYCPHNYILVNQSTEGKFICEAPQTQTVYYNDGAIYSEITDICQFYVTYNGMNKCGKLADCKSALSITDNTAQIDARFCKTVEICNYKVISETIVCVDDCAIFGVELVASGNVCEQSACDSKYLADTSRQLCLPCFGTENEVKMITIDGACEDIANNSLIQFKYYSGYTEDEHIYRVQVDACELDMKYLLVTKGEITYNECTQQTLCSAFKAEGYYYTSSDNKSCIASCGQDSNGQPYVWEMSGEEYMCKQATQCGQTGKTTQDLDNQCIETGKCEHYYYSDNTIGFVMAPYKCTEKDVCPDLYPALKLDDNQCVKLDTCNGGLQKYIMVDIEDNKQQCQYKNNAQNCNVYDDAETKQYYEESTETTGLCVLKTLSCPPTDEPTKIFISVDQVCVESCVNAESQPLVWYEKQDGQKQCLEYTTCFQSAEYSYISKDNSSQCVASCGEDYSIETETEKKCVSQCTEEYAQPTEGKVCSDSCPYYVSGEVKICISDCDEAHPVHVMIETRKECLASCADAQNLPYKKGNTCVDACGADYFLDTENVCQTSCENKYWYYYKTDDKRCTAELSCSGIEQEAEPKSLEYLYKDQCVAACTEQQLWSLNKTCYDNTCPEGSLLLQDTKECRAGTDCPDRYSKVEGKNECKLEQLCDADKYVEIDGKTCVENCGEHVWYVDGSNNRCVDSQDCPVDGHSDLDKQIKSNKQCVSECVEPNKYFEIVGQDENAHTFCLQSCEDKYYQENQCVAACTNEYAEPVDAQEQVCSTTCNFFSLNRNEPHLTYCIEDGKDCKDVKGFEFTAQITDLRKQCSSDCSDVIVSGFSFQKDEQCVNQCDENEKWIQIDQDAKLCTGKESCSEIDYAGKNYEDAVTGQNQCKAIECQIPNYHVDTSDSVKCIKECPTDTNMWYNVDEENRVCINGTECPEEYKQVENENQCVTECPEQHKYTQEEYCVAECDQHHAYGSENVCSKTCVFEIQEAKQVCVKDESCGDKFKSQLSDVAQRYQCTEYCYSEEHQELLDITLIYEQEKQCVQLCGSPYSIPSQGVACDKECTYYVQESVQYCAVGNICTEPYPLLVEIEGQANTCVKVCPEGLIEQDNKCIVDDSKGKGTNVGMIVGIVIAVIVVIVIIVVAVVMVNKRKGKKTQSQEVPMAGNNAQVVPEEPVQEQQQNEEQNNQEEDKQEENNEDNQEENNNEEKQEESQNNDNEDNDNENNSNEEDNNQESSAVVSADDSQVSEKQDDNSQNGEDN